jgi:hypothetical protein
MIDVPVAPCVEGDVEAWVEILGVQVQIRMTTQLEVDEAPFQGTLAEFIAQAGDGFLELKLEPPAEAPFVALDAEVETPEAPAP